MSAQMFLDHLKALAAEATEGPWHGKHEKHGCVYIGDFGWVAMGPTGRSPEYGVDSEQGKADAEFIAHARTDVPRLVAALEAVLEAHKPVGRGTICPTCDVNPDGYTMYPCPTVQAIESALGGNDDDHR